MNSEPPPGSFPKHFIQPMLVTAIGICLKIATATLESIQKYFEFCSEPDWNR